MHHAHHRSLAMHNLSLFIKAKAKTVLQPVFPFKEKTSINTYSIYVALARKVLVVGRGRRNFGRRLVLSTFGLCWSTRA